MLWVNELFHSIQGEGPFSGRPAVFLRLSGCVKPYCSFCDTKEALEKGKEISEEKILEEILSYKTSLVVITGGEPFLQWQTGLQALESGLIHEGLEIQYESSGRAGIPENVLGKVVLSPKPGQWPSPEIIKRAFALKPLMEEDPEPVLTAIQKAGFPLEKIWLMALGASREEQLMHMPMLWNICMEHGYHFCPRLHILVHDRKKGV